MAGHPEKMIDFAHRALHETTVQCKAIVTAFYGSGAEVLLLQRLLDRRAAGADGSVAIPGRFQRHRRRRPGDLNAHRAAQQLWVAMAMHKDEASFIPADEIPGDS